MGASPPPTTLCLPFTFPPPSPSCSPWSIHSSSLQSFLSLWHDGRWRRVRRESWFRRLGAPLTCFMNMSISSSLYPSGINTSRTYRPLNTKYFRLSYPMNITCCRWSSGVILGTCIIAFDPTRESTISNLTSTLHVCDLYSRRKSLTLVNEVCYKWTDRSEEGWLVYDGGRVWNPSLSPVSYEREQLQGTSGYVVGYFTMVIHEYSLLRALTSSSCFFACPLFISLVHIPLGYQRAPKWSLHQTVLASYKQVI